MTSPAELAITASQVWAVIATASALATVATIGERLLVPARARRLPAPAPVGAVTISAAVIWIALQHRFPDDQSAAEFTLYALTFIAATAATIILAITPPRARVHSHAIGLLLLGVAAVGLLLSLIDAYVT
jgi:hypothetical protein